MKEATGTTGAKKTATVSASPQQQEEALQRVEAKLSAIHQQLQDIQAAITILAQAAAAQAHSQQHQEEQAQVAEERRTGDEEEADDQQQPPQTAPTTTGRRVLFSPAVAQVHQREPEPIILARSPQQRRRLEEVKPS
jgi:hypothetical protein